MISRPHQTSLVRTCSLALQICLLSSLFACGTGPQDDRGVTTINLSLNIPATSAQLNIGPASPLTKLVQWLPSIGVAWAQVSEIGQLRIDILASNGANLGNQTVPVPDPTSGQIIPVSIKAPAGPQRRIAVSALDAAGTKIYSGKTDTDLIPGTTISLEITLAPTFEVTVTIEPAGGGTVRSSPPGLECNAICSVRFDAGSTVVLSAIPAADWSFVQWGRACTGRGDCTVSNTATVSAQFQNSQTSLLTVTKTGPLATSGTVSSVPGGINCGTDCSEAFPNGTSVTLSASQGAGVVFSGWSGGGCGGSGPCTISMTENRSIEARFDLAPGYSLIEITKTGTGTGTVVSNPGGINCGDICSAPFPSPTGGFIPRPTVLTLVATPAAGSTFNGWGGVSGCGSDPTCVMFVFGNQSISAQFTAVEGS